MIFLKSKFVRKNIIHLSLVFLILLFICPQIFSQTSNVKWLYFGTDAEASRYYLRSDTKKNNDGYFQGWMKTVFDDLTYSERLYQWDCKGKRMNRLYLAAYYANNKLLYKEEGKESWEVIIPDTLGDRMLNHLCGVKIDIYWAEVTSLKANMRLYPGTNQEVLRIANKGQEFRIISFLNDKSWYNVVDEETQEDYWVHKSTINIFKKS